ncbi:hypothetical protein [Actinoplanes sp. NPDC051494]|uniref:hypothetical protein n=1 Tax=Actinoplanes sp. NPDC051494 TaxID=3363907 RepID=UPI0037B699B3
MTTAEVSNLIRSWQFVPEQQKVDAVHRDLVDASAVLDALQNRPDWGRQPGEIQHAHDLVNQLVEERRLAEGAALEARAVRRREMYPIAAAKIDTLTDALATQATTLTSRVEDLTAALAALVEDLEGHCDLTPVVGRQRHSLLILAAEHGDDQDLIPPSTSQTIPPVPRPKTLIEALRVLRRALRQNGAC